MIDPMYPVLTVYISDSCNNFKLIVAKCKSIYSSSPIIKR